MPVSVYQKIKSGAGHQTRVVALIAWGRSVGSYEEDCREAAQSDRASEHARNSGVFWPKHRAEAFVTGTESFKTLTRRGLEHGVS